MSFSATLPVKPSVTTTSATPVGDVVALDVADEVAARRRRRARAARRGPRRPAACPSSASSPLDSSADARALDAEDGRGQRGAHEARTARGARARTSALAPTSSSVTGAPGHRHAGSRAPGGGCPCARLMLNRPAASAAPVEPPETSASASPSATARAAWTIEASGVERDRARRGRRPWRSRPGASTTSTPVGRRRRSRRRARRAGRARRCAAAIAAPAATSAGPRSAPLASTATVTSASADGGAQALTA